VKSQLPLLLALGVCICALFFQQQKYAEESLRNSRALASLQTQYDSLAADRQSAMRTRELADKALPGAKVLAVRYAALNSPFGSSPKKSR